MFKKAGKFIFRIIGGRAIGRVSRWVFLTAITFWGPGPIIAVVGYEGLLIAGAVTHSGLIEYAGDKIVARL